MLNIVVFFSKSDQKLDELYKKLESQQDAYPHQITSINIDEEKDVYQAYLGKTPVVEVGPYHLYSPFTDADLKMTLGAAKDRQARLVETEDPSYQKRIERGREVTGADRASLWLTRNYMWIFNLGLLIFVGLPFLAPVFEKMGWTLPGKVIYTVYSPLCHQLAFRSWFLYGEQTAYPRELAGVPGLSYEKATGIDPHDVIASRGFIGNSTLGYKVAICERDVAIYAGMLFFGILFTVTGRKLKSIPWYVWVVLGMVPMGIDGFSQLPGLLDGLLSWLPIRESTPLLRTITGLLFGITTAWYGFPYIEDSMVQSRKTLLTKFAVTKVNHD